MAKLWPCIRFSSSSQRETYTIWMKSLVFNSNGFTVYNSCGQVVYRIDNYDSKCRNQVYLMDLHGNVVCTILRKKLLRFGLWECYNDEDSCRPWFEVGKSSGFFKSNSVYDVVGRHESVIRSNHIHKMEGFVDNLEFNIMDGEGRIAATVQRKRSALGGVELGEDVLLVTVEPHVDHLFVMALVAIHGLISHRM